MKFRAIAVAGALSLCAVVAHAQVQLGSAFTYQGELKTGGSVANGVFDMQFRLYNAVQGGMQAGSTLSVADVTVAGGRFSVPLDFGSAAYNGEKRWLEISVKADAAASFTTLNPRHEVTATPYALASEKLNLPVLQFASTAGGFGTSGLFHMVQEGNGHAIVGQTSGSGMGFFGMATGTLGSAGRFWNSNALNDEPVVSVTHTGSGWGVAATSAMGRAGSFEITNASNPNIALYGYTAGTGHGVQGYSVGSGRALGGYNNGTGNAGYFRIGNDDSSADAVFVETLGGGKALSVRSVTGPAVYARSSNGGPAIQTDGGGLKVTGAGVNTNTWVYIHQTSSANTSGTRTYLNHPLCNNNPNAIIIVTNRFNGGGIFPRPVAVGYDTGSARWYLHDMDNEEMANGGYRFNIMIVVP